MLGVARPTLSRLPKCRGGLSPEMAIGFEKSDGPQPTSGCAASGGSEVLTTTPTACSASILRKSTNFYELDQELFDQVTAELTNRPRQVLGWKTPHQAPTVAAG